MHSKLLGYLKKQLNYKEKPPQIVVITDLARDYDDLAAMVMVKELHRLGLVELEGFVANIPESKRKLTRTKAIKTKAIKRPHEVFDMPPHMKDDEVVPKPGCESARTALDRLFQKHAPYPSRWILRHAEGSVGSDTSQFSFGGDSLDAPQEKAAEAEASRSRRHRRGRGPHQVVGLNGSDDPEDPVRPFPGSLSSIF
jgi:hypothetical protein